MAKPIAVQVIDSARKVRIRIVSERLGSASGGGVNVVESIVFVSVSTFCYRMPANFQSYRSLYSDASSV
jgi:hypothetical protein